MSNTIQHYSFNDFSSYGNSIKLNKSINELNSTQNSENVGQFAVVKPDDAVAVEISELAKNMYDSSLKSSEQKNENESLIEKSEYEGLSNAEREQKELEDYIRNHPVDKSIDVMRKNSLTQYMNNAKNAGTEDRMNLLSQELKDAFTDIADEFADFSMKITYGDYSSNDISVNNLNFEAIDKMEDLYRNYKEHIETTYEGDEKTKNLNMLDDTYNSIFAERIINPVRKAYEDKLTFLDQIVKKL